MKRNEKRLREELKRLKKRNRDARKEAYRRGFNKGSMITVPIKIKSIERRETATINGSVTFDWQTAGLMSADAQEIYKKKLRKEAADAMLYELIASGLISYRFDNSNSSYSLHEDRCIASVDVVLPPKERVYKVIYEEEENGNEH